MTTTVVDLAALLGDTIDHAHYVIRDGQQVTRHKQRGWCCWLEYGTAMKTCPYCGLEQPASNGRCWHCNKRI